MLSAVRSVFYPKGSTRGGEPQEVGTLEGHRQSLKTTIGWCLEHHLMSRLPAFIRADTRFYSLLCFSFMALDGAGALNMVPLLFLSLPGLDSPSPSTLCRTFSVGGREDLFMRHTFPI